MTLAETQALFHHLVTGDADGDAASIDAVFRGSDELPAADRLAIYRDMYTARLLAALRETFPHLARLLGERFGALGEEYLARHPSEHHDVGQVGRRLAAFLHEHPDPERPDLRDLAELEWARNEAFFAPGSEAVGAEALAALPPELAGGARLRLSPSLRVLFLAHDAAGLWRRLQRGEDAAPPSATPTALAVWRRGLEVFHCALALREAMALETALDGGTLEEICEHFAGCPRPAEEAHAALSGWFSEQWVAGVVAGP